LVCQKRGMLSGGRGGGGNVCLRSMEAKITPRRKRDWLLKYGEGGRQTEKKRRSSFTKKSDLAAPVCQVQITC